MLSIERLHYFLFGSSLFSMGNGTTIYSNLRPSETAAAHPPASRRGIRGAAA
jgi:hypothetical protein